MLTHILTLFRKFQGCVVQLYVFTTAYKSFYLDQVDEFSIDCTTSVLVVGELAAWRRRVFVESIYPCALPMIADE